jgi:drug/metabolite transporter (DMT)-like permease
MRSTGQALVTLHLAVALFGCSALIGKQVTSPALVITCVRSLVGALALGMGLWLWRRAGLGAGGPARSSASSGSFRWAVAGGGVLLALHWWAFFAAVQGSTVALGLLTYASYPLFATLLEPVLFRERLRVPEILACAGVALGLVLVVPDWNLGSRLGRAAACGIGSGLAFAILSLLNRRLLRERGALELVVAETGVAGVVLLPLTVAGLGAVPPGDWAWLGLLGVVFTGFAHWAFTAALSRVSVRLAGVTAALEPVYGIAFAWLLFRESVSARTLVGGALILGATALATASRAAAGPAGEGPGAVGAGDPTLRVDGGAQVAGGGNREPKR